MNETVDEVIRVTRAEGIDADIVKGGDSSRSPAIPRSNPARGTLADELARGDDDDRTADRRRSDGQRIRCAARRARCWHPHCARIHPAKLAAGLADVVERWACRSTRDTRVTRDRVRHRAIDGAGHGHGRPIVLRATEGFTAAAARPEAAPGCR